MNAQCPHCNTKFRVTKNQLDVAKGFVRCGVCKKIFNIKKKVNIEANTHANLTATNQKHRTPPRSVSSAFVTDTKKIASEKEDNLQKKSTSHYQRIIPRRETNEFFDENINQSLTHVVPERIRRSSSMRSRLQQSTKNTGLILKLMVALLTLSLFVEFAWFNRYQLNIAPQFVAALETVCPTVICNNIHIRIPEQITMLSRNIYSHPNETDALMLSVKIHNRANFAQPFPIMQLDFSNQRGIRIATRRFLPAEYLSAKQLTSTFKAGETVDISLEVKDPGSKIMTYEFNFL